MCRDRRSYGFHRSLALVVVAVPLVFTFTSRVASAQVAQTPRVFDQQAPFVFEGDVRELPRTVLWQPGDSIIEFPDLRRDDEGQAPSGLQRSLPRGSGAGHYDTRSRVSALTLDFDGIPATGVAPPDPVGDVGPNHYIQMVNISFSIYDKAGSLLAGPSPINALWAGFGGPCETSNNGDPIVRYDHLADRWMMSQFAIFAGFECIAISRTSDPVAGGWYLYAFPTPGTPDYPKIGVWPDGYYMGTQRGFPNSGLDVYAFDRVRMLSGLPAGAIMFNVSAPSLFLLPSDLDGPPPPTGTPNFFARQVDGANWGGVDRLEIFAFTANWANPGASTFTQIATLPTAPYDAVLCTFGLLDACVPQPGTNVVLEGLTVWTMWRLQYRNFGTHESLVTNHTVDADGNGHAGIRWYELRRPPAGAWTIFQQGTYAPDTGAPGLADDVHRWMGSIAMDGDGGVALGYSASSGTVFPGLRYAGRAATDPVGTLPVGEVTLVSGGGSQTGTQRWGNYSTMDVDPVDDCTFWFTGEYYAATSNGGWRTRVSSFKLPSCGVTPAPPVSPHQVSLFIGGLVTEDALALNSGFETGFRYRRHRFTPSFSGEAELGLTFTDDGVDDGLLTNAQIHLIFHPIAPGPVVQPFFLAGLGLAHFNRLGFSDTSPLLTAGLGVDYEWLSNVGFRLDLRWVGIDGMINPGFTHNFQLLWGPVFSF